MIPVLYRANLNYLLRHPWQLAMAVLGVSIGVAVIVAVDLANDSARKAFLLSMDAVTGEATHQVVGGPRGVDEDVYVALRTAHGIRNIAPVVDGFVTVEGRSLQVLGVDLFAEQEMRTFSLPDTVETGAAAAAPLFRDLLTEPGAALMSRSTAEALGLATGERFEVLAGGKRHAATLRGTFAENATTGLDNLVTVDIATAQSWLGQEGQLSRIDVRVAHDDAASLERLEALLTGPNEQGLRSSRRCGIASAPARRRGSPPSSCSTRATAPSTPTRTSV